MIKAVTVADIFNEVKFEGDESGSWHITVDTNLPLRVWNTPGGHSRKVWVQVWCWDFKHWHNTLFNDPKIPQEKHRPCLG